MSCPTVVEIQPPSPKREDGSFDVSDNDEAMNSDRARSPSDAILMRNRLGGSARYVMPLDEQNPFSLLYLCTRSIIPYPMNIVSWLRQCQAKCPLCAGSKERNVNHQARIHTYPLLMWNPFVMDGDVNHGACHVCPLVTRIPTTYACVEDFKMKGDLLLD